jgi:ubiquinone/menaquinone biosynthesis C-methylase UbiE
MNGKLYDAVTFAAERYVLGGLRRALCAPLTGNVYDVGAGTGANFRYYNPAARVTAIEPDARMLARAVRRVRGSPAQIRLVYSDDSYLETLPAASADAVIFALVLCTVPDPGRALLRARRVLRSGGTLAVLEHVRSEGFLGALQDRLNPLWGRISDGCHLNRRTANLISAAGFDVRAVQPLHVRGGVIADLIAGPAT